MSSFSWSVDPIACALGLLATWLAWKAYRSSTRHVLRVVKVESGYSDSVNPKRIGYNFRVSLLNLGLPVNKPAVCLEFKTFDDVGPKSWSIELKPFEAHIETELSQGMRGTFELWIKESGQEQFDHFIAALCQVKSSRLHGVSVVIKNAGYEVQRIPLYSVADPILSRWNSVAFRFNRRFESTKSSANGRKYIVKHKYMRLPEFDRPASISVSQFCESLKPCGMVIVH